MRTLADFVFDLAQNSINAKARNVSIFIDEDTYKNTFTLIIKDDGKGIKAEDIPRVTEPFYTTRPEARRRVGLGLALMEQACREAGGELKIESELGTGTTVSATLVHDHVDRAPAGDFAEVFTSILVDLQVRRVSWTLEHKINLRRYKIESEKLLGELGLTNYQGLKARELVSEYLAGKEASIYQ